MANDNQTQKQTDADKIKELENKLENIEEQINPQPKKLVVGCSLLPKNAVAAAKKAVQFKEPVITNATVGKKE